MADEQDLASDREEIARQSAQVTSRRPSGPEPTGHARATGVTMNKETEAGRGAVAGQVERPVRPAAVGCEQHVSGGAVVRWAGSGMPCPAETQLYTQAALDAAVSAARDACASAAWIHYMDVCKARGLAPSEHEHWNAARTVREA